MFVNSWFFNHLIHGISPFDHAFSFDITKVAIYLVFMEESVTNHAPKAVITTRVTYKMDFVLNVNLDGRRHIVIKVSLLTACVISLFNGSSFN